ncbi:TetR/AcrR family transcriptional regulator [Streptomyces sp. NBC_01481]|uniref:TetR/AcrR family transcriptional regulator n=1 Tax=Streptomyces sp. NBC_01481 TaxID=2975869 RepID=UPI0022553DEB|nr:TetR/AcrR family transcriptional regulator [Streptomyces sp. NBC_01481]MCX4585178.1 TetR/AcrR family transcriptional regulator [Streptomyces sp. NBC_01481]
MSVAERSGLSHAEEARDARLEDESPTLWGQGFSEVGQSMLTSAVRCFAAKGFQATRTRDITAGAKLSPASLYVHFASKEDVLFTISRFGHERALAALQGPEDPDAAAHLRSVFSRFVAWHARHHVAGRVNQYEMFSLTPEHYEEVLGIRQQTTEVFRKAVLRGIADGSFVKVDVNRVVRAMLSLAVDLVRWYRLDGPDSPEQLGEFYAELALGMVTNPAIAKASGESRWTG